MALTDLDDVLNDLPHNWTAAVVELTIYEGPDPTAGPILASAATLGRVTERLAQRGVRAQPSPHPGRLRLQLSREPDEGRHATDALLSLDRVRGDVSVVNFATPTRPALVAPAA
jgi:hypothetical protein